MGRCKKIKPTTLHSVFITLAALLLMSACTPPTSSVLSEPPTPAGTKSATIATITPLTLTREAILTPTVPSLSTTEAVPATATPAPDLFLTPVPLPAGPLATLSLPIPLDDVTIWYLPGSPNIAAMRDTIVTILGNNELEFDLGYPVQGFSPDPIYPRLFIRDTSTLMTGASYFYPAERLRWGVEAFLRQQYDETTVSSEDGWRAGFGAISATVGPDGAIDKATAVSDEDTHLIHAAYVIYQVNGGADWLAGELNGLPVITRLNAAGQWLLAQRRDGSTGLIKRDHTTDWGDVRFQPTNGNPTDIVAEDVVWTASIYDQALAYRAWRELAAMNRAVGDEATAQNWDTEAESLRSAVNAYLWQPDRGFYRTHLHLTPLAHDFDEDAIVSIANAVAMISGLTDSSQDAGILSVLEEARLEAGARKTGLVLYPPYPTGFFAQPFMGSGTYQNGGVWDWWGGWQVLAEFESGYSQMARTHLSQTAADWATHPAQIFEWQDVTTLTGAGGDQYAGAAGVYAQVVVEALYGVRLSLDGPSLSPRLADWPGSIAVHQPANGSYLRYSYQPSAERLDMAYETLHQAPTFPLRLLLLPGFTPGEAWLDGRPLAWDTFTLGQDTYLTTTLPTGRHSLVVESQD